MAGVRLKRVCKRFDGLEVLHDISLAVDEGEFVVLVGPSGCGKSTTLRLIAGLEDVTEGEVLIDDRVVNLVEPRHRNIAMVFQNYALYPHKNVRENIIFGLKRAGAPRAVIEVRLKRVAEILELEDLLERKPAHLSGGQRQRVAMGRALVRDANVFLFDEPLSNLDAKLRHQMRAEIRRIHREYGTTSIYVTHDQVEAMSLGDRVVVMRDGYIEQQGTPMDIYLKPENTFVAGFIGAPSMNMLDALLFQEHVELEGRELPLVGAVDPDRMASISKGRRVTLGIRPDFFMDEKHVEGKAGFATLEGGRIDLIEPLGFDQELSVQIGEQSLRARLDLRSTVRENEVINLCFDMRRAHFFDPESGKNLFI